jgi:hypothetical protein
MPRSPPFALESERVGAAILFPMAEEGDECWVVLAASEDSEGLTTMGLALCVEFLSAVLFFAICSIVRYSLATTSTNPLIFLPFNVYAASILALDSKKTRALPGPNRFTAEAPKIS